MKRFFRCAAASLTLAAALAIPCAAAQSNVDVDALKFTAPPTFDGIISEEEWGPSTVTVYANQAATNDDEKVNEYNTYIEFTDPQVYEKMYYTLWLRYDDEYFYVGVKVHDVDGHAAPNGNSSIWNNDVVQLRIDPQGPNSAMLTKDPDYNYKTTEFDWKKLNYSSEKNRAWKSGAKLLDACFALIDGYNPQAWDTEEVKAMPTSLVNITTVKTGNDIDDFSCETTYEIAIPWGAIGDKVMGDGYKGETGKTLGMTLQVRNSCGASYDSILTWGSGLDIDQAKNARKTSGGSQAVTLSAETVTPAADYPKASEPATDEVTTEATPITTAAPGTTDEVSETQKAPSNANKPNYSDVKSNSSAAVIIAVIAAVVVVGAVVVAFVIKRKK